MNFLPLFIWLLLIIVGSAYCFVAYYDGERSAKWVMIFISVAVCFILYKVSPDEDNWQFHYSHTGEASTSLVQDNNCPCGYGFVFGVLSVMELLISLAVASPRSPPETPRSWI